jgi:hypothetical protein
VQFGLERPVIRGVSFQLATYCFTVEHINTTFQEISSQGPAVAGG